MKYTIKATQTIYKFIEVEADSKSDAFEKAQEMEEEGLIRFDDEPFMKMEVNIDVLEFKHPEKLKQ